MCVPRCCLSELHCCCCSVASSCLAAPGLHCLPVALPALPTLLDLKLSLASSKTLPRILPITPRYSMRWPVIVILWTFLLVFRASSILALKVRRALGSGLARPHSWPERLAAGLPSWWSEDTTWRRGQSMSRSRTYSHASSLGCGAQVLNFQHR